MKLIIGDSLLLIGAFDVVRYIIYEMPSINNVSYSIIDEFGRNKYNLDSELYCEYIGKMFLLSDETKRRINIDEILNYLL